MNPKLRPHAMELVGKYSLAKIGFLNQILFCLVLSSGISHAEIGNVANAETIVPYEAQIEPSVSENFDYAAVQLWIPPACHKVKGILCVILHPLDHGGSRLAHPEPWIELASSEGCALMAISFAQSNDLTRDWCRADQGTGRALFASLDLLARKSGIASLSTAPIVTVGVCAAGQFAFHLTAFAPSRVTSFVTIGGGQHDLSKIGLAAKASALVVVTPDRGASAVQNLQSLYAGGHARSASWQTVSEPISKYDAGFCSSFVISFLQSCLAHIGPFDKSIVLNKPPNTPTEYLPISICGEKLTVQATAQPTSITLAQSVSPSNIETFSFDVFRTPSSNIDTIFIPAQTDAIQTNIENTGPGQWHVVCRVDQKRLPLGNSNLELRIRFLQNGGQILGGLRVTLSDFVEGDITWNPRNVNFGALSAGIPATIRIRLASKSHSPVEIRKLTCTHSWIGVMPHVAASGDTELWCTAKPPTDSQCKGFSGYFQIAFNPPQLQPLRIFYYGSISGSTGVQNAN